MKRNQSIDIARGIGILLVVLGHSWFADTQAHPEFRDTLAAFRMPLFFFVSGLFLSVSARPADFVKVRVDALLKPYFVVLLSVWAIYGAKDLLTGQGSLPELATRLLAAFYGTGVVLSIPPLWFLPLLFLASISCYFVARRIPAAFPRRTLVLLLVAGLILAFGVSMIDRFWGLDRTPGAQRVPGLDALPGLPWSLDLLPISLAFMLAGLALREQVIAMEFRPGLILLAAVALIGLRLVFDQSMDLNMRRYDGFLVVTLQAFAGIYVMLGLSVWLRDFPRPRAILIHVGQGALFILLFHYHIQRYLFAHLRDLVPSPWMAAALAYAAAIAVPLLMLEVTRRSSLLSALLLPNRASRPRPVEGLSPVA